MLDSSLIVLFVAGTIILILFTFLLVFFTIHYRSRLNQHHEERERLLNAKLEEGERMMNQIAKEVHDNIGQLSNFLKMTLRQLEKYTNGEESRQYLEDVKNITDQIIIHSNNISHSLNSDFIKQRGFLNVLQDDIEYLRRSGKLNCKLQIDGPINDNHPEKDLLIYRIAQEVINNIIKHSGARNVDIDVSYIEEGFSMEIKDDGSGFDPKSSAGRGIGLENMRERTRLLNGDLQIMSQPGSGCTVTLSIPDF
ncbi:MAG: sensor histidine kinase [Flavipsychrobacter sp.]